MRQLATLQEVEEAKEIVRRLYKNRRGQPFELTDGQAVIFTLIFKRKFRRVHIEAFTRYGKSETIALAILTRRATFPGKTAVVAGGKERAEIIMGYVIEHIFDNGFTKGRFVIEKGESEENIRRYRNKDKINFNLGKGLLGEIFITSATSAIGKGADDVIEDEAGLIPENEHALVMRMLDEIDESGAAKDSFLCKVTNSWESEHCSRSLKDAAYKKLIIDYRHGLQEGRITPEKVEEARKEAFFDVLYECKRPKAGMMDEKAWIPLFTREEIDSAMIDEMEGFGINKLGADVAGGGRNFTVIVQRRTNFARVIHKTQDPDTMNLAEEIINRQRQDKLRPEDISIDRVGVGKGAYDILNRTKETAGTYGINAGETPTTPQDDAKFVNQRAEFFWKLREWIKGGGKLQRDDDWYQLANIKYRTKLEGTHGKMVLMSKEEMAKDGIPSPDVADALSFTFRTMDTLPVDKEVLDEEERLQNKGFDPWNPFGLEI